MALQSLHSKGTRYKIGDWVVTPRSGKPVEIQALWYNALHLSGDSGRRKRRGSCQLRLKQEKLQSGT
jgi:glycogen debranching enzyme